MSEPQPQGNNSKKYRAKNEEDRAQYNKPKRNYDNNRPKRDNY